tara:strand:+ start:227 stop:502 length:276 start_codon:yes stop_codon:yes gene_type:complete
MSTGKQKGCLLKILKEKTDNLAEKKIDFGKIVVDTVNEIVSGLPIGHKNRNPQFARGILAQVFEILSKNQHFSSEEVEKLIFTLAGRLQIL